MKMPRRVWSFSTLFVLLMCITSSYKGSVLGNTSKPSLNGQSNASEIFWRANRRVKTTSTILRVSKDVNSHVKPSGIFVPTSLPILSNSIEGFSSLDAGSLLVDGIKKTEQAPNVDSTLSSLTGAGEPSSEPSISIPTQIPNSKEKSTIDNVIVDETFVKADNDEKQNLVPTPVASGDDNIETTSKTETQNQTKSPSIPQDKQKKVTTLEEKLNDSKILEPVTPDEDMPSFDEWKKKKLAEHTEGEKPVQIPSIPGKKLPPSSKRRRNYASSECGAKIVAANVESEAPNRILNEQMDAYMLNPCKAKIWFIIELCESIHTAQFELANFELFSSLPRDFSLYWSDHFPTRDWTPLGTFIAPDQRGLHTFDLKHQGYGKFLKVELHSYYGKEHYCPLSLVRVYGTSMVDEYEEMEIGVGHLHPHANEADGDFMDAPAFQEGQDDSSRNLFGSARDAVLNIVRKAARALGREEVEGKIYTSTQSSLDVGDVVDEDNSTLNDTLNKTTHSLWKNTAGLGRLLDDCGLCVESEEDSPCFNSRKCLFFLSIFNISTIAQFCQTTACSLVTTLNYTNETVSFDLKKVPIKLFETGLENKESVEENSTEPVIYLPPYSDEVTKQKPEVDVGRPSETISEKVPVVVGTDTLGADGGNIPPPVLQSSLSDFSTQNGQPLGGTLTSISSSSNVVIPTETLVPTLISEMTEDMGQTDVLEDSNTKTGDFSNPPHLMDITHTIPTRNLGVVIPTGQKESVFMRLSNRIKILEMNMSLSSLYLQELSQRYRRQMEDMQRGFNRTVQALNDTAQLAETRDKQQQEAIKDLQTIVMGLKSSVDQLSSERELFYRQVLEAHLFLLAVETIVVVTIMTLCMRRLRYYNVDTSDIYSANVDLESNRINATDDGDVKKCSSPLKRHNSTNDLMAALLPGKKRRPSEIVSYSGNYNELLIVEPAMPIFIEPGTKNKRKNRHRKAQRNLLRSLSNPNLNEDHSERCSNCSGKRRTSATYGVSSSAAGDLFGGNGKNCENCCFFVPSLPTILSPAKQKIPLQNVTNGSVSDEKSGSETSAKAQVTKTSAESSPNKEKEHFSFRKLLKFRKNEAV